VRWGLLVFALGATACTLFTPFGTDLTSGEPVVADSGTSEAASAADTGTSSGTLVDASADVDAGDKPAKCTKAGDIVRPVRAFDATPAAAAALGNTCNLQAVLVEDGQVAGLDRKGDAYADIDGQGVVACVGVEMPEGTVIDRVLVRVSAVGNACGGACELATCGTGRSFPIYVGTSETNLVMAKNGNEASAAPTTLDVPAPVTVSARFVVVCRSIWGAERDDIAVDSIAAICR
jgi:hypothetical protein